MRTTRFVPGTAGMFTARSGAPRHEVEKVRPRRRYENVESKMSLEGQVLDGKYAIVRRIAEGGTSTVYLGVNQRIGKDVAVKVLRPMMASDPEAAVRFEREARIVSRIRSAHVADVFDFGELPTGERFMVMEYLDGESLATLIQRARTLPAAKVAAVAVQILDALAAAHSLGVVHRDLKPENVLVTTRRGELVVKVVDFGISTIVCGEAGDGERAFTGPPRSWRDVSFGAFSRVTAVGSVLGTPLYMSPEQACGETGSIDHRTDIYSLGVMLYEALCGEPPHSGDDMNELLLRIALDEPQPLAMRLPFLDEDLGAIVERALAKDPSERFQSADEMRFALEAWRAKAKAPAPIPLDDVGIPTVRMPALADIAVVGSPGMFARFGRMRRWAISALFASVGLFVGVPALQARLAHPADEVVTMPTDEAMLAAERAHQAVLATPTALVPAHTAHHKVDDPVPVSVPDMPAD